MVFFSLLCPPQQVGQRLERDTAGTVDPNGPKGHFLQYAIMLCNEIAGKGGGGWGFWLWLSFSQATIVHACFSGIGQTLACQQQIVTIFLFCCSACTCSSFQGLPAFALLILPPVPLWGEWLSGCLDAGWSTHNIWAHSKTPFSPLHSLFLLRFGNSE